MTRPWFTATGSPVRAWTGLLVAAAARAYRAMLLTLLVVAVVPMAWGWRSYAVHSGSMEPSFGIGDVVVASPVHDTARVGRVMVFTSPETGRTMVHRVVARLSDGRYTTKGDATLARDPEPVPPSAFSHQGRLLVPYIALPAIWWSNRRYALLTGWAVVTIAALILASRRFYLPRHRPHRGEPHAPRAPGIAPPHPHRPLRHAHAHGAAFGVLVLLTCCGVMLQQAAPARAVMHYSGKTGVAHNTWSVTRALQPYTAAVLADSPYLFYRVDEASGTTANDSSGNNRNGTYAVVSAYGQAGALSNNPGYSIALAGSQGRVVGGGTGQSNPTSFTVEMWFKTSTSAGGKLFGFDSTQNATSPTFDRLLQMQNGGKLQYGSWANGGTHTITTTLAYNDGKWHYLAVTSTGATSPTTTIYIDGVSVISGTTTNVASFTGYWHFGYGPVSSGSSNFTGNLDQLAVYTSVLSSTRIAAHYAAR